MLRSAIVATSLVMSLCLGPPRFAAAGNYLEIGFELVASASESREYAILMAMNKDGASTCQLATGTTTYALVDVGGSFGPGLDFIADHWTMSYEQLVNAISIPWTVTWDTGPLQTVATIDFGVILDSEFPPIPIIVAPEREEPIQIPGDLNPPVIYWSMDGSSTCDYTNAEFHDQPMWWQSEVSIESGELPCTTTFWVPAAELPPGSWYITVRSSRSIRDVPVGLSLLEGEWLLENEDWLALLSSDNSPERVGPTSAPPGSSREQLVSLSPATPNPFNPSTQIELELGTAGKATLGIYDLTGRLVRTLMDKSLSPGHHSVTWNGKDDAGRQVASGVYLYQLRAGDHVETKRMVLLK